MANAKGNPSNLIKPSSEQARKNGKKGGIQSAKSRNEKKAMKEHVLLLLESKAEGKDITRQEELILAQYDKALQGDTRACEFLRDTSGQKPRDSVELSSDTEAPLQVECGLSPIVLQLIENIKTDRREE